MSVPILIVAAWEPELAHLRGLAEEACLAPAIESIGVGMVEAAVGMTRCIARHVPGAALFVGTCGSLAPALAPSDADPAVVAASSVTLVDAAVLRGEAELPGPMAREVAPDPAMLAALVAAGARPARVATTLGVTVDDGLASLFARAADVEHLEAFAFACACAAHGIPFALALGVANPVGSQGREAWRANHGRASAAAAIVVARAVGGRGSRAPYVP